MDFPQPEPGDDDDVAWAIQTANTMYKRGDRAEAIRWLQRAAGSAEAVGDDDRLLALARAAAEFANEPAKAASHPPPPLRARPPPPPRRVQDTASDEVTSVFVEKGAAAPPPPERPQPVAPAPAQRTLLGAPAPPPAAPAPPPAAASPAPTPVAATATPVATSRARTTHRAVRVSVMRAASRGTFVVRPLSPGERPPAGAREALLVPLDPDDEFAG